MCSFSEYDDVKLLAQLAEGEEAAFNALFNRYKDRLYHYLLRITKSPEMTEEIVMDVFLKLWIGKDLLHNIKKLDSFLYKVAYNKAIDFLRTVSRHDKLQKVYIDRVEMAPARQADELLMDEQARQLLREAIQQLPPRRKLIYTLSREKGLTHDQIAKALNLSANTVKNSIVSATKSISAFLKKSGAEKAALSVLFLLG